MSCSATDVGEGNWWRNIDDKFEMLVTNLAVFISKPSIFLNDRPITSRRYNNDSVINIQKLSPTLTNQHHRSYIISCFFFWHRIRNWIGVIIKIRNVRYIVHCDGVSDSNRNIQLYISLLSRGWKRSKENSSNIVTLTRGKTVFSVHYK